MKIVGFMVVGANEKYLRQTLEEFKRLCDDAVIACNNTDPETDKLINSYGFWHYKDNREWGIHQPQIKRDLLIKIGNLKPDWIIALDADEKFAPEFTRAEAERLAMTDEIAYYFMIVNLYNDREHFAHGEGIQRFWNIRYFKYLPEYGLDFQSKRLHCGLAPPMAYNYGHHAPFYIEHYGLMDRFDRQRKVKRYQLFDKNAIFKSRAYYDDLSKELTPYLFDRQKLLEQLRNSVDCAPRTTPKLPQFMKQEKYVHIKRLKDGMVLDIPADQLDEHIKRGGFALVNEVNVIETVPEVVPVETEMTKTSEISCPICERKFKSQHGLNIHKASHA